MTSTGMRIAARIVAETPQPAVAGEELERKDCPAAQIKSPLKPNKKASSLCSGVLFTHRHYRSAFKAILAEGVKFGALGYK